MTKRKYFTPAQKVPIIRRHLLEGVAILCIALTGFAHGADDVDEHFEFLDRVNGNSQVTELLSSVQAAKPWTEVERALVTKRLREVQKNAPGLYARVTSYGRIQFYRSPGDQFEANGYAWMPSVFTLRVYLTDRFFASEDAKQRQTLVHELIHVIDGDKLSFSHEWVSTMRPAYDDLGAYLKRMNLKSAADAFRKRYDHIFVQRFGFNRLYACVNLQESLAELGAFLVNDPGPENFNPPDGVREFVRKNLLSTDFTVDPSIKPFVEGMRQFERVELASAEASFSTAILEDPEFADAYLFRGATRVALGKLFDGINDLNRCEKLWTQKRELLAGLLEGLPSDLFDDEMRSLCLIMRGEAWSKRGEPRKAINDFTSFIDRFPKHPAGYLNRGRERSKSGQFEAAIEDLNTVLEMEPDNLSALFLRTQAKSRAEDWKGAEADATAYLARQSRTASRIPAFGLRADARKKQGRVAEGISDLRDALKLDESQFEITLALAMYYRENKQADEALRTVNKAILLRPEFGYSYYVRGNIHLTNGDRNAAVKDFYRAQSLQPALKQLVGRALREEDAR